MENIKIDFKNCYGIKSLEHEFNFSVDANNNPARAYAIYAPNGIMKTSFSRTFEELSKGRSPKEERYNRPSTHLVEVDGTVINQQNIYVLKSEIDISADTTSITNILVDPQNKARYDGLLVEIDKLKTKLTRDLQKSSGLKQAEIEEKILSDFNMSDFYSCIKAIKEIPLNEDLGPYTYNIIFDPKALAVLESSDFISKANEFNLRYQELFDQAGSLYQKGVFNPSKAETSFDTLNKQGFFAGGHRVHLKGEAGSITKEELDEKLKTMHSKIDEDADLKRIQKNLAKNAQTEALTTLIEGLTPSQFEFLLEETKSENQKRFKKNLWTSYIAHNSHAESYLDTYEASKEEITQIETEAAQSAPRWSKAVELFNDRFIGMPFSLAIANQAQAVLGKATARLKFIFKDGPSIVEYSRDDIKTTLSQGEKRALFLLNFIFDAEERKANNIETLFVMDDIADSFDYKNKQAIVQYLDDLTKVDHFHQIILTHNFDFFRSLANSFVHRNRCLMTSRDISSISLSKADGIKNYFINIWKSKVTTSSCILCATIPFTRNLIEYTKGDADPDYLKLTSLLHWKSDTDQITEGEYLAIYNNLFGKAFATTGTRKIRDILFQEAQNICAQTSHTGLNLEDKVLLSIAIRMQAEIFLTNQIRILTSDNNYWCTSENQFGVLIKKYIPLAGNAPEIRIMQKVSVTVSSNIHLNSFMYEPILDLTIDHLIALYNEIVVLNP